MNREHVHQMVEKKKEELDILRALEHVVMERDQIKEAYDKDMGLMRDEVKGLETRVSELLAQIKELEAIAEEAHINSPGMEE